jgi:hypothetical protein
MKYNFEQFEYVLSIYGLGSTYFLKRHPAIKQMLIIVSTIFFCYPVIQLTLTCCSMILINFNFSYLCVHLTILLLSLTSLISFIYTTFKIDLLRQLMVQMHLMAGNSRDANDDSSHTNTNMYRNISIAFISVQIVMLSSLMTGREISPVTEEVFAIHLESIFTTNISINIANSTILPFISSQICFVSRLSNTINCIYFLPWKIVIIIIYIIFYRKFDQSFFKIFNGESKGRTSREQYNTWRPTDIIQVNEISLKLFELKNNLNRYLMFLFITSFIDIITLTLNVFSMCRVFYEKGDNWVNIFLSIIIVLIYWVFFLMIFIRKLTRERNKRASNLDIISGIHKLRTNNYHFSLYQTELTNMTIQCLQMKFINFAK